MFKGKSSKKKISKTKKIAEIKFELHHDNLHDVSVHIIQKLIPFGILCKYSDIKENILVKLKKIKKKVKQHVVVTLVVFENRKGVNYKLKVGVKI